MIQAFHLDYVGFELLGHKFKHLSHIEAVWISGICKLYIYETSEDFGNKTQQK